MTSRISSGSSRADIAVEPARSQNITVSWRRSAASVDEGVGGRTSWLSHHLRRTKTCDRFEEPFAIPQGDAKFFKVAVRQIG